MQKILGRFQNIMQIEKNSKFHISYDSMDITVLKLYREKMIGFCQYINMVTHFSTLAWKIPWMEELGGLQSMGCKESDMTEQLHFHFTKHGKGCEGM